MKHQIIIPPHFNSVPLRVKAGATRYGTRRNKVVETVDGLTSAKLMKRGSRKGTWSFRDAEFRMVEGVGLMLMLEHSKTGKIWFYRVEDIEANVPFELLRTYFNNRLPKIMRKHHFLFFVALMNSPGFLDEAGKSYVTGSVGRWEDWMRSVLLTYGLPPVIFEGMDMSLVSQGVFLHYDPVRQLHPDLAGPFLNIPMVSALAHGGVEDPSETFWMQPPDWRARRLARNLVWDAEDRSPRAVFYPRYGAL